MADYIEILDTQIEPDAPLTAALAAQFRDNPEAIAEGASGAPRIDAGANAGAVAGDEVLFSALGGNREFSKSGDGFFEVPGSRFRATTSGEYRISFEHRRFGGAGTVEPVVTRVRINGGIALTESKLGDTFSEHSVDINITPGDVIVVEVQGADASIDIRRVEYRTTHATRHVGGI